MLVGLSTRIDVIIIMEGNVILDDGLQLDIVIFWYFKDECINV